MNKESNYPPIDPELEARIVALMLGEASDFERDELNRIIDQRPEVAAFKQEIQRVHGMLLDVGTGDAPAPNDEWKLPAEKRHAVLSVISGEPRPVTQAVVRPADQRSWIQARRWRNVAKIAAVLFVGVVFTSMMVSSPFRAARERHVASSTDNTGRSVDAGAWFVDQSRAPSTMPTMPGVPAPMGLGEAYEQATAESIAATDSETSLKSSLSDIRESLQMDGVAKAPHWTDDSQSTWMSLDFAAPQEAAGSGPAGAVDRKIQTPAKGVNGVTAPDADGYGLVPQRVEVDGEAGGEDSSFQRDSSVAFPDLGDADSARLEDGIRADVEGARPSLTLPGLGMPSFDSQSGQSSPSETSDALMDGFPERGGRAMLGGAVIGDAESRDKKELGFADSLSDVDESAIAANPQLPMALPDAQVWQDLSRRRLGGMTEAEPSSETASQGLRRSAQPQFPVEMPPADAGMTGAEDYGFASGGARQEDGNGDGRLRAGESAQAVPSAPVVAGQKGQKQKLEMLSDDFDVEDRFAKERSASPRDESVQFQAERDLGEGRAGVQDNSKSEAVAAGQLRGKFGSGQASQRQRELFGRRPKDAQKKLTESEVAEDEALPRDDHENVESYWERLESQNDAGRSPLGKQSATNEQNRRFRFEQPDYRLEDDSKSNRPTLLRKARASAGLNEKTASEEPFSTFSLHVSDVSFKLARAALASGSWPEAASIRIEEFVNAFDYGDPMPSQREQVACRMEQSIHPFVQQRNMLRISMRTAAAGRSSGTPLRLTFLLDNSGSMERIDRQQTVRRAFAVLASQLKSIDQVTLISFARQPRLLADQVSGSQADQLVGLVDALPSEGGTNIEAALQLAFEKAREQQIERAQNRIVLLTDGAVNLGDADPDSLSRMIVRMRDAGIAFDAAGIGAEGLNDEILEALTRKGDGRYYLLDSVEAVDEGFARQIAGALRPSAKNVKVQIEFNPNRVGQYKLLGFEKHRLKQVDFRDDNVDAAEMAAAEAGVAVYQFEAKPDGEGDIGKVSVRFRDVASGQMIEHSWPITYQPNVPRLDQAPSSLRIATCAAFLAAKLRGDALGETVNLKSLSALVSGLPEQDRNAQRVQQLRQMIEQARQVSGE